VHSGLPAPRVLAAYAGTWCIV